MTTTSTVTSSFTTQSARYLVGKVAADLMQIQLLYGGKPTDKEIGQFILELVILLAGRYVHSVKYGYVRQGSWVLAVGYDASYDGLMLSDDHPGSIPGGRDMSGASWCSFLIPTSKWYELTPDQREEIERGLPFRRSPAAEPGTANGSWQYGKTYSKDGGSLRRGLLA